MKRLTSALLTITTLTMMSCNNNNKELPTANTADNSPIENIMTRTSVRQYDSERTISSDTVEILLRAAMAAPTAVNKQPWQFVVLDEREAIDSLCTYLPYAKMLEHAPLAIVTCGDLTKAIEGEGETYWIQDVSAATENLLLAAHALGLGAVWTGLYPISDRVKGVQKALGMPDSIVPLAVVPVGYPAMDQSPKDKWDSAKVHYNKY
ncbi:MAG: nitroreductase family protein [Muribaculaceae bacterium]|nr:nitroreductase family protein [Muribaculaceae bacterium]